MTGPFIPLILPALIGAMLIFLLTRRLNIPLKGIYLTALSLPLGLAVTTLGLFVSYAWFNPFAKFAAIVIAILLAALLTVLAWDLEDWRHTVRGVGAQYQGLQSQIRHFTWPKIFLVMCAAVFLATFFYFVRDFVSFTLWNPFGGWDAKTNWNLKAAFLFRAPTRWSEIFSNRLVPQMGNYPLLVPAAIAWGWNWLNAEPAIWPPLIGFIFALSLGLLILWYVASQNSWPSGLLAASFYWMNPAYRFWATSQYADIPLCFFITAAILTLVTAHRRQSPPLFFLAGLLTGFAAWSKNEGVLFTLWAGLIFGIALILSQPHDLRRKLKILVFFLLGLSIPYAAVLYLKIFLAPPDIYSGHVARPSELLKSFGDWNKSMFIAAALAYSKIGYVEFAGQRYPWNGLWILFLAALVYALLFKRRRLAEGGLGMILSAVLLIELGYFFIFHITPINLQFHLSTSAIRLALHHGILALIFAFEVFSTRIIFGEDFS